MTYYKPCRGCRADKGQCERRREIKAGLAGLAVTAVNFKCAIRKPLFEVGDRVQVTWEISDEYDAREQVEFAATVVKETKPGQLQILVDPGRSICEEMDRDDLRGNGYAKVSMERLARLDEGKRAVCAVCQCVTGVNLGEDCYWSGTRRPDGCIIVERRSMLP